MATFDFDAFLEDIQAYSDEQKDEIRNVANRLENEALSFSTLNTIDTPAIPEGVLGGVDQVSSTAPDLSRANLDWDTAAQNLDQFQMPTLVSDILDKIEAKIPGELNAPIPDLKSLYDLLYTQVGSEKTWLGAELGAAVTTACTSLVTKLQSDISTGGTGISSDVQDAIFNQMYERDAQATRDALEFAESNVGRRGFTLPNMMSQGERGRVIQEAKDVKNQRAREITVLIAERAQNNVQFATSSLIQLAEINQGFGRFIIEQLPRVAESILNRFHKAAATGIDLERVKVDYAARQADVFSALMRISLDKFRAENEANIAEFDGKVRKIMAEVEIAKANASLLSVDKEILLKQWQINFDGAVEQLKAQATFRTNDNQRQLEAIKSLADLHRSVLSAAMNQVNAITVKEDGAVSVN